LPAGAPRITRYFNLLKVLIPIALSPIGLGIAKGIFDMAVHRCGSRSTRC
jgi:hypothetical protein